MYEEVAFDLIEHGHPVDAVMSSELSALLGYAIKKMERNKLMTEGSQGGSQTQGNKRTKVMTSEELVKKARAKKG